MAIYKPLNISTRISLPLQNTQLLSSPFSFNSLDCECIVQFLLIKVSNTRENLNIYNLGRSHALTSWYKGSIDLDHHARSKRHQVYKTNSCRCQGFKLFSTPIMSNTWHGNQGSVNTKGMIRHANTFITQVLTCKNFHNSTIDMKKLL